MLPYNSHAVITDPVPRLSGLTPKACWEFWRNFTAFTELNATRSRPPVSIVACVDPKIIEQINFTLSTRSWSATALADLVQQRAAKYDRDNIVLWTKPAAKSAVREAMSKINLRRLEPENISTLIRSRLASAMGEKGIGNALYATERTNAATITERSSFPAKEVAEAFPFTHLAAKLRYKLRSAKEGTPNDLDSLMLYLEGKHFQRRLKDAVTGYKLGLSHATSGKPARNPRKPKPPGGGDGSGGPRGKSPKPPRKKRDRTPDGPGHKGKTPRKKDTPRPTPKPTAAPTTKKSAAAADAFAAVDAQAPETTAQPPKEVRAAPPGPTTSPASPAGPARGDGLTITFPRDAEDRLAVSGATMDLTVDSGADVNLVSPANAAVIMRNGVAKRIPVDRYLLLANGDLVTATEAIITDASVPQDTGTHLLPSITLHIIPGPNANNVESVLLTQRDADKFLHVPGTRRPRSATPAPPIPVGTDPGDESRPDALTPEATPTASIKLVNFGATDAPVPASAFAAFGSHIGSADDSECIMEEEEGLDTVIGWDENLPSAISSEEDAQAFTDMLERKPRFGPDVPASFRRKVVLLVRRFKEMFSDDLMRYNPLKCEPMTHPQPHTTPKYHRRHSPATGSRLEWLNRNIPKLVEAGILKKVHDVTFALPTSLQQKPGWVHGDPVDKRWRLVVDGRPLNAVIDPVVYDAPTDSELVSRIGGAKYFAVFDMTSAYFQLKLDPSVARWWTISLPGHFGTYQFLRGPMGSAATGVIFSSRIAEILGDLMFTSAVINVDDLIVYGRSEEDFLANLEAVLDKLIGAGVILAPSKATIVALIVRWCGRLISEHGVILDPRNLESIRQMPEPRTFGQLHEFLHLSGWMRSGVAYHGPQIECLRQAVKSVMDANRGRKSKLSSIKTAGHEQYTQEVKEAFHAVRDQIVDAIQQAHFDPDKYLVIMSDASTTGYGFLVTLVRPADVDLSKPAEMQHSILVTGSGMFKGSASRWSVVCKESFALITAVLRVKHLMEMSRHPAVLLTDSNTVNHMYSTSPTAKGPTVERLQRWGTVLMSLRYVIRHVSGVDNVLADVFSRWAVRRRGTKVTVTRPWPSTTEPARAFAMTRRMRAEAAKAAPTPAEPASASPITAPTTPAAGAGAGAAAASDSMSDDSASDASDDDEAAAPRVTPTPTTAAKSTSFTTAAAILDTLDNGSAVPSLEAMQEAASMMSEWLTAT